MKKMKVPSPGTVIALIALAVALGGTAYAAKKISTKQLANNAVKTKKIANGAVTRAKLAGDEQVAWALVDGTTNTVLAQSGGVSLAPGGGAGAYFVKFPVQLTGRALTATIHSAQGGGEIAVGVCGSAVPSTGETLFCNTTNPADNSTSTARVETSASTGTSLAKRFYVAVLGK